MKARKTTAEGFFGVILPSDRLVYKGVLPKVGDAALHSLPFMDDAYEAREILRVSKRVRWIGAHDHLRLGAACHAAVTALINHDADRFAASAVAIARIGGRRWFVISGQQRHDETYAVDYAAIPAEAIRGKDALAAARAFVDHRAAALIAPRLA